MMHSRLQRFATLLAAVTALGVTLCPPASVAGDRIVRMSADGAWCWFQDPRAVYLAGERTRTYACWVTSHGDLQIGAYDHANRQTESFTVKAGWGIDDHNAGSILVLPDHRLMVFYAQHNAAGLYCRTTTHPEDITAWGDEITVTRMPRVTYSHPAYLTDEHRFYVFWRGESWKPTVATSSDGITWSEARILVQEPGHEGQGIRPYLKAVSDGKRTIHLAFTDGHPRDEVHNSVYYLRYEAGRFTRADGALIGTMADLPLRQSQCERVYDATRTRVRAWIWDIALDSTGFPSVAYTQLPAPTDHRYHVAQWNGTVWDDNEVAAGGRWFPQTPQGETEFESHYSGGIALRPGRPSTAYVSRQAGETFRLEKWGRTGTHHLWQILAVLDSSSSLNVRPVVPAGYGGPRDHVLWMNGTYVHYTRFLTQIEMMVPE